MIKLIEIERFALHDGPGIRTVVFLQGCSLYCPWCANPESQIINKHLMHYKNKCIKCKACLKVCPIKAIDFKGNKIIFNRKICNSCDKCAEACTQNAIAFCGEEKSIEEIIKEIMKDKDYYEDSKGGVTISGGEPFLQYKELLELLRAIKGKNIHTAVETTGNVEYEKFIMAEPLIDLFLFDIKHLNKDKLKDITGGDLNKIIKNLNYIALKNPDKLIVRVPVIPDFNYDDKVINEIMEFVSSYKIKELHLLPFHNLGKNKYEQLGRSYLYKDMKNLNKAELLKYIELGESMNIKVKIGG
ncbi:glycyl-radical enzyme activating protein [Clostridium isatidis]|nr:glycyl-radical enzyme activating protein [Clostridium isatidis]